MAENVGVVVVRLVDTVVAEEGRTVTVRNDGAAAIQISKDPELAAGGADAFVVAANTSQDVHLEPGESLFAVTASGSASVELI